MTCLSPHLVSLVAVIRKYGSANCKLSKDRLGVERFADNYVTKRGEVLLGDKAASGSAADA